MGQIKNLLSKIDQFYKLAQKESFDDLEDMMKSSLPVHEKTDWDIEWSAWKNKHPNASDEEREVASRELSNEMISPFWKEDRVLWKEYLQRIGKPNGGVLTSKELSDWDNFRYESNKINQQQKEFDDQDKEIADFKQKEQDEKASQQKSIDGKTIFTQSDARTIVNSFIPKIKTIPLKANKENINFIFYDNGNVGITSQDIKSANIIRTKFALELSLALKQYLLYNKKYFKTSPISVQITI